jgi:hypothetical protein
MFNYKFYFGQDAGLKIYKALALRKDESSNSEIAKKLCLNADVVFCNGLPLKNKNNIDDLEKCVLIKIPLDYCLPIHREYLGDSLEEIQST